MSKLNRRRRDRQSLVYPTDPRYRLVLLANGGFAIVDEEDYEKVAGYTWYKRSGNTAYETYYAKATVTREGKNYTVLMHRVLYGLDSSDRIDVDHRNHDGLDNRRSTNLRLVTKSQNTQNSRKNALSTSHYKGVSWRTKAKKFTAKIRCKAFCGSRLVSLGDFIVEEEAAFAYCVAAELLFEAGYYHTTPIPLEKMPAEGRQRDIRSSVVGRLKGFAEGRGAHSAWRADRRRDALTTEEVAEIERLVADGVPHTEIASRCRISISTLTKKYKKQSWIKPEQVRQMVEMAGQGVRQRTIAERLGVSEAAVSVHLKRHRRGADRDAGFL